MIGQRLLFRMGKRYWRLACLCPLAIINRNTFERIPHGRRRTAAFPTHRERGHVMPFNLGEICQDISLSPSTVPLPTSLSHASNSGSVDVFHCAAVQRRCPGDEAIDSEREIGRKIRRPWTAKMCSLGWDPLTFQWAKKNPCSIGRTGNQHRNRRDVGNPTEEHQHSTCLCNPVWKKNDLLDFKKRGLLALRPIGPLRGQL